MLAPEAVSVANPPAQITDGDADALTLIEPFTNTVTKTVEEQPLVVPVTEYVVVTVGLTPMLAPVCPVLQTKELAPLAVRTEELPTQIAAGEADTDTLGAAFTATVTEAVPVQPLALVPVTV